MVAVKRFDVIECQKNGQIKPALVISPDEMNQYLSSVLIAPITRNYQAFPCRLGVRFQGEKGQIALDLIQVCLKKDILKRCGMLPESTHREISAVLQTMFSVD